MKNKKILVTNETKVSGLVQADLDVACGKKAVKLTHERFIQLKEAAKETSEHFERVCLNLVDKDKALFVRDLRCSKGHSWRAVAQSCYDNWNGDWYPSSNQLMGMAICERAAFLLGEDCWKEPWN